MSAPLLSVEDLVRDYPLPRRSLFRAPGSRRALHGVDLTIRAGESFGLVGESGSGKSTLARAVLGLEAADGGRVLFRGQDIATLKGRALRDARRDLQMIFQDPFGSLDPRQRVGRIVAEPLDLLADLDPGARRERVAQALEAVGLPAEAARRYPHAFSGGQRQRIAIARALITRPALIVADEPVSALDVSVQAQVLNLMAALQAELGLAYLFISHDLGVVRHVADRVAVLYLGRIVEEAPTRQLFTAPRHPYSQALLAAAPRPDPTRRRKPGGAAAAPAPDSGEPDRGCPYAPRCPMVEARCRSEAPALRDLGEGQKAACHFA